MTGKKDDTAKTQYRKPTRLFEKSGVVNPKASYCVFLENVVNTDNQDIKTMVDLGRYFSIFAPRQSGKSTFLEQLREKLHRDPVYIAIMLSFQDNRKLEKAMFYEELERYLYQQLIGRLKEVKCEKTKTVEQFLSGHHLTDNISFKRLFEELNLIIQHKKIIIFIDEFDGIPLSELEPFLTSLRELYLKYKKVEQKALYSVGLVGIRNITKLIVGGISPFNIADQVDLPSFSLKDVIDLYGQYTAETNQPFTPAAMEKVYRETSGQPWLVNRLGTILTVNLKPGTVEPIDRQDVEKAIDILIDERNIHFDNLDEKARSYKETFVEIVFDHMEYSPLDEDQTWLEQFGLIKKKDKHAVVSNNIYKSRYLKAFFKEVRAYEEKSPQLYELPGGRLDMERILLSFDRYIAQIGVNAFYKAKKPYEKTGQFLLTAWLYQFVMGGKGQLGYEVISGLGRMDVFLTYKEKKYIIETKLNRHDDISGIIDEGIFQLTGKYLVTEGIDYGYLVIFDTRTPVGTTCKPWVHEAGIHKITVFTIGIGVS